MSRFVTSETAGEVGIVTLNRPDKLNALSTTVMEQIHECLSDLEPRTEAIIFRTTGEVFSAGADLHEIHGSDAAAFQTFQSTSVRTYRAIQDHPSPVIAVVDGLAYGGGCALAVSADMLVAEEGAEFALPEVTLGLVPAGGGFIQRLVANIGMNKAIELLTTGEPMVADEAHRAGLTNRLAAAGAGLETARSLAEDVTKNPGPATRANAEIANQSIELSRNALASLELEASVRSYCYDEAQRRIDEFADKRTDGGI